MSVVGSAKSITAVYQRQFSERDGDLFYDALEPSRRLPTRIATDSPLDTPERLSPVPSKTCSTPTNGVESPVPAVLPSATQQQAVPPSPIADSAAAAPPPPTAAAWIAGEPSVQRRLALPEPKETQKSVSLWSIIKEAIGKDLTRICLPVYFNEPLSALQKMVEEVEYSHLLDKAGTCPRGSMQRMAWLAVFAISG